MEFMNEQWFLTFTKVATIFGWIFFACGVFLMSCLIIFETQKLLKKRNSSTAKKALLRVKKAELISKGILKS